MGHPVIDGLLLAQTVPPAVLLTASAFATASRFIFTTSRNRAFTSSSSATVTSPPPSLTRPKLSANSHSSAAAWSDAVAARLLLASRACRVSATASRETWATASARRARRSTLARNSRTNDSSRTTAD
ncbi:unnamed protein product [Macrosiphum euphorbiae]|uniref:Uncharacterized protein n=1 Tax=Macrosiphum euphorbiae TaxID=13131 RepID=A0AAV0WL02_9HEMI|nr:unnamed protein product [Macrosiphum euphorbiae]